MKEKCEPEIGYHTRESMIGGRCVFLDENVRMVASQGRCIDCGAESIYNFEEVEPCSS